MKFNPVKLLESGDMSTSLKSIGIDLNQAAICSIQAIWQGAPKGKINLEISNDIVPVASVISNPVGPDPAANVINWSYYTGSNVAVTEAGDFLWILKDVGYRWIRLSYTPTSGSGVLKVVFSGKGV